MGSSSPAAITKVTASPRIAIRNAVALPLASTSPASRAPAEMPRVSRDLSEARASAGSSRATRRIRVVFEDMHIPCPRLIRHSTKTKLTWSRTTSSRAVAMADRTSPARSTGFGPEASENLPLSRSPPIASTVAATSTPETKPTEKPRCWVKNSTLIVAKSPLPSALTVVSSASRRIAGDADSVAAAVT